MIRRPSGRLCCPPVVATLLFALIALPGIAIAVEGNVGAPIAAPATLAFRVTESDQNHTVVEVLIPDLITEETSVQGNAFDIARIPGADPFGSLGEPLLAVAGTLIAIPSMGEVNLHVLDQSYDTRTGLSLMPVQDESRAAADPLVFDQAAYAADRFLPSESVTVGEPAIMRDLRVVPLRVYPIQYNPTSKEARVLRRLTVELTYSGSGGVNVLDRETPLSRSFEPLYESLVANFDFVKGRSQWDDQRGKYLIVTADAYYSTILPLANWKHRRGMEVEIAKLSVIGSTSTAIKTYIQNAYNSWQVRPAFILLVGDTDQLPTGSTRDDYYATLAGSDYLVDVHLGRLSCDDLTQCGLIVAKMMGYEKTPYMTDPNWFKKACLIVRDDYDPPDDAIYYGDTWYAYNLMHAEGMAPIDTLFAKHGANQNDVHNAVTNGRVIVNYRGQGVSQWWSPFAVDPALTNPGYKLPVVVSATCGTGTFYGNDGYPCETWMRAGTVSAPKGSVAFLATSMVASGVAQLRSYVDKGIFDALFNQKIREVGGALDYAKYRLYINYPNQNEYAGWNCQGDPEMDIWTSTPKTLAVTHPAAVPPSSSNMLVEVRTGGNPVELALVCAYAPGEVYASAYTNGAGQVTLPINPATADTVFVTVSGHNLYPYQGHAVVTPEGPYLTYASHSIDDSVTGNNDGLVSPGETVRLTVGIQNVGPEQADAVAAKLRTADAYTAPIDSTASYGNIAPGQTKTNADPLSFSVADDCLNGHGILFSVFASEGARDSWTISVPSIAVSAADLAHSATVVNDTGTGDGDGILEPGETAWLTLTLRNDGPIALDDVTGVLSTADPYVVVTDAEGEFGAIAGSGGTAQSTTNSFRVSVSPGAAPARQVSFTLAASGDGGTYQHEENLTFSVTLGGTATMGPCGPDAYGYYAYDTTDAWTGQAPVYSWVELVGTGTTIAAITNADAAVTPITLPFTFKYYGTNYTQISACSNGFLAMGVTDYRMGDNSGIPNTGGPAAMIAPLWDDLDPSSAGDIYQWSDTANHRYIIQFDAVVHYGSTANPETFEVIFLDPAYYPTASGNGIILFQYQDPRQVNTATVGIENVAQTDGIQYEYNGTYHPAAAPIVAGQAVKFTTDPPAQPGIWLAVNGLDVDDSSGGNGDGQAQPTETVDLIVTLLNRGTNTASGVSATLSTSDPDVTIVDGTGTFGSIAGGGSGDNSASPFTVTIGPNPDSDLVQFDLHIATGSRYDTWDVVTLTLDLSNTGIEEGESPVVFALRQNSPNPFGQGTAIAFDLPEPAHARLDVYSAAGRRIATVVDGEFPAGRHAATWDGRDSAGNQVAAGVYFYRLQAGSHVGVQKMIVLK